VREVVVVYDPAAMDAALLTDKVAVVIDVLRATSSMLTALAAGASRIVPVAEVDDARILKAHAPAGSVVLGGERGGRQIDGFDIGNTPQEFTADRVRGKTVVMTTTNGTRAILMAMPAREVVIAALVNATATACHLADRTQGDVVLVGSGTEGRVSYEDALGAGAIVERLLHAAPQEPWHLTDSALMASDLWHAAKGDIPAALRRSRGGRNVAQLGLDAAFESCGALDAIDLVARVGRRPAKPGRTGLEIVAVREQPIHYWPRDK